MLYTCTTIEQDPSGELHTVPHPRLLRENLAALVELVKKYGYLPGNESGVGTVIVETIFTSAE